MLISMKMHAILIAIFLCLLSSNVNPQTNSPITLSEVMFYPLEDNGEFIEIYNTSKIGTVDLSDFKIKYYTSALDNITPFIGGTLLKPGQFAIIIESDYDYENGKYKQIIPPNAIVLKIADGAFGSSGMANTTNRNISLLDAAGNIIDSYEYSADNPIGYSDEKFIMSKDNSSSNWKNSLSKNGTPGLKNSISPAENDLAISILEIIPNNPSPKDSVTIKILLQNYGQINASAFTVELFDDINYDSTAQSSERFFSKQYPNLVAGNSVTLNAKLFIDMPATKVIIAKLNYDKEENPKNNISYRTIIIMQPPPLYNQVIINEVMYAPLKGEPEWIEIVNISNTPLSIYNWSVSDFVTATKAKILSPNSLLLPGEYTVIASDTSSFAFIPPKKFFQCKFGTLGNTNDGVIIYDYRISAVDSMIYKSNWGGGNGFSLERISFYNSSTDSLNWTTSFSPYGATPGIPNSAANPKKLLPNSLIINEIMYEPLAGSAEFLEFYNTTNDTIQAGGMELKIGSKVRIKISKSSLKIPPHQYFVLASDSTIYSSYNIHKTNMLISINNSLSLSNEGNTLVIKNLLRTTLDSLNYLPEWHNKYNDITKGKSLERLNPLQNSNDKFNWSTNVSDGGCTPGMQNSIFTQSVPKQAKVSITPNPFSPDSDGFEDFSVINLELPYKLAQVRITVFDSRGRHVRTIDDNKSRASSSSIIFDGLDNEGNPLRIGIYILLIEIFGDNSSAVQTFKTPVVIARKL